MSTIYLRRAKLDRLESGHPWIYASEIEKTAGEPQGGDIAELRDHKGRYLGRGYYNPKSQITVRRLTREHEDIDEAFFRRRIKAALLFRIQNASLKTQSCYRLISSEADFLPGLIVDKYSDVLVVQSLTLGIEKRKEILVKLLVELLQPKIILERSDAPSRKLEGLELTKGVLWPKAESKESWPTEIEVNGLKFSADLLTGQKTGFFLDQQENYRIIADLCASARPARESFRVLDCFCYHGGFALHAAKAGAKEIVGVEMSADALAVAKKNSDLNGVGDHCQWIAANVFDYLTAATKTSRPITASADRGESVTTEARPQTTALKETRSRQASAPAKEFKITEATPLASPPPALTLQIQPPPLFDLVVLDPPTFTRSRDALDSALRGYKEIHLRALKLLRRGGYLATFCCSHHVDSALFRSIAVAAATDAHRDLRLIRVLTQSADHPILPAVPETEYLKGFVFQAL